MADTSVRPWTRPHDWAEVVLGLVALLSPLWMDTTDGAMWTMIILGALVTLDGLASLAMPGMVYGEMVQIVMGVLMFISPWVIGYTEMNGIAWTSWIVGALIVIAGGAALPIAQEAHRSGMAGQH
ncbi:SPW repeat-containing protein [Herbihabitans rhizosphaerae]|uniref:SPW repeat-containing protein n=1 Tax=Herbihabitans rhizosphaerae TaxID=1872711 RepID=A0A4Q7KF12_9PSEU|nr:SPW repeat protein [Herbihabitans rhizosphaerae]RZS32483.1 SPW repeat-containing protein [Herbihabitans rhizosphaerae]